MQVRPADPRDVSWERDGAVFRVHLLTPGRAEEYEVSRAGVREVQEWAAGRAGPEGGWELWLVVDVPGEGRGAVLLDRHPATGGDGGAVPATAP